MNASKGIRFETALELSKESSTSKAALVNLTECLAQELRIILA